MLYIEAAAHLRSSQWSGLPGLPSSAAACRSLSNASLAVFSSLFLDLPHLPQRPCVLCSVLRGPTANFLESFESRTATTAKRSTATRTRGATHAHAQAGPRYPLALGQQLKDGELKIVSRLARAHAPVSLSSSRRSSDTVIAASRRCRFLHRNLESCHARSPRRGRILVIRATSTAWSPVICDAFITKSHHGPYTCIVADILGPDLT